MTRHNSRRLPVGAEAQAGGGVHFRVWAPTADRVSVVFGWKDDLTDAIPVQLRGESGGYWSGDVAEARTGMSYRYQLDGGAWPDPASRFQPLGPHGASQIIDPGAFAWSDHGWGGVQREGQVIYEMHIGTFTRDGSWAAAMEQLPHLADLGVTLIEVMPVADFPGRHGWGYDGVNLFAPTRLYGEPDDFRRFVDRAHASGLGVILDVVYNHLGPEGNYLRNFSRQYFSSRYKNDWGDALNFDDEHSGPVREFFVANAGYWIGEFHLDGLRLDATQQILDVSRDHVLGVIARRVREAARGRGTYLVAEDETQRSHLVRSPEEGGCGLQAMWNDDFHHAAMVALTGRQEAYYMSYRGSPQEFISVAKRGFLYQGQRSKSLGAPRGEPGFDLSPASFVNFLQNHDQIANSLAGRRLHTMAGAGRWRALTALLLLGPNTPMLFQGQEFAASAPFLYFADHPPELARAVAAGRAQLHRQFPSIAVGAGVELLPDPGSSDTFQRCKLNFSERQTHAEVLRLHRDLLHLRRDDPVLGKAPRGTCDGAVLDAAAFVLRFFGPAQDDRLLLINLGPQSPLDPAPEPLLAPPRGCRWKLLWSSEDAQYGGSGTLRSEAETPWNLAAESAVLLASEVIGN